MAYTTVDDVKTHAGITSATDDALLTSLMASAQQIIDNHTKRTFEASANTVRYFDALSDVDGRTLYLDADLCAIDSITNGNGATVASTEYTTLPRNETPYYAIRLKRNSSVFWTYSDDAEDAIQVSGKWAFSETADDAIAYCCKRLTVWLYNLRKEGTDLDRALIVGDATILPTRLPADVLKILDNPPYRKVV